MNPTIPVEAETFEIPPEAIPDLSKLVTQDDEPVDSMLAEKQQRLLTEPLYSSWGGSGDGKPFLVLANVCYFYAYRQPAVVPDVLLSLDVEPAGDLRTKEGHSYYQWLLGKPPDVIIEIVSDLRGGEESLKMSHYARQLIPYYVIFDPAEHLRGPILRAFVNMGKTYQPIEPVWFPDVGLGVRLWEGVFEGQHLPWLRWCDQAGQVIPTGAERAEQQRQRAEQQFQRAERLAAQLRALGIDPEA